MNKYVITVLLTDGRKEYFTVNASSRDEAIQLARDECIYRGLFPVTKITPTVVQTS